MEISFVIVSKFCTGFDCWHMQAPIHSFDFLMNDIILISKWNTNNGRRLFGLSAAFVYVPDHIRGKT
jgi:hypothetical protein